MIATHRYVCPSCGKSRIINGPAPVKAIATGRPRNVKQCKCGVMMRRRRGAA